eukprot:gene17648-9292_t
MIHLDGKLEVINMQKDGRVFINVRGTIYETCFSTLSRFPETLLGSVAARSKYLDIHRNELIFDRNIEAFESILFYYQSNGILAKPIWLSLELFEEECRFFGIHEDRIAKLRTQPEGPRKKVVEYFQNTFKSKAWQFFENPESSTGAKVYSIVTFALIIISLSIEFALTVPEVQRDLKSKNRSGRVLKAFMTSEMVFHVFFATDFVLRIFFSPSVLRFFISATNIIDILAIFPYFMKFSFDLEKQYAKLDFLRVLRTVRVLRMFRLSKHSRTLDAVISIIRNCFQDFLVLAQCILVACVLFASITYFAEQGSPDTQFTSIPESMWWALQTMVCLGYGDIVPITLSGKIAGSWVAIIGAVTLTVPLVSIGGKYMFTYTRTFSLSIGRDMNMTTGGVDATRGRAHSGISNL